MDDSLKSIMREYMEMVDSVCIGLMESLQLRTKAELGMYKASHLKYEYEANGITYIFHGRGCCAYSDELYLDWNFGCGSRWCGIDPWLLARTLKRGHHPFAEGRNENEIGDQISAECGLAATSGEMVKKYDLYYFTIPVSETFKPDFPEQFDTLLVEHLDSVWKIPRNKLVERFLRKSSRVYGKMETYYDLYTLRFLLDGEEVYRIFYADIGYGESAARIMKELLGQAEMAEGE